MSRLGCLIVGLFMAAAGVVNAGTAPATPPVKKKKVFKGQVTVTATGARTPVQEVPAAVTVIGRAQMDDAQTATVAGLLRRVPGLTVMQSGDVGSVTSVFTRGTNSNQTLVLFDGVRLNSPYFGGYDFSQLPTAGLARIEVVRGPYSALWGADAVGGVINLIPQRARAGVTGSLLTEGGEDGWARFEGQIAYSGHGADLFASGFHRDGHGQLPNSAFDLNQGLLDAGWSWGRGNRVALLVQSLSGDTEIPFSGATTTPRRHQSSTQTLTAIPVTWHVRPGWTITTTVSHVDRRFAFRDPDDAFGFTRSDTSPDTDQARLVSTHRIGNHTLSWGGAWRRDTVDDSSSFGINLDDRSVTTTSGFVQDLWRITDRVRILAGARLDHADRWGSQLSPRIGAGWAVAPGWDVHASWGEAFRQPSIGELYFPYSGNPDLNPETSISWEVGAARTIGSRLRVELDAFRTHLGNLIDFDYATYRFMNVTTAKISGAELGATWMLTPGLNVRTQATWLDTRDDAGRALLRRPRWAGTVTLSGRASRRLRIDLTTMVLGVRDDIDPVTFARRSAPGVVTANLALAWRVQRTMDLTIRIVNLFDRRYQEVLGYPAPRQRILGGLRIHLR